MPYYGLEQVQRASQIQTLRMSQQQIQSMKMLAMNAQELRTEIYKEVEKNPALEIVNDPFASGMTTVKKISTLPIDYTHLGRSSASGEEASDDFQSMLENSADMRESLQDHLMEQLNLLRLSPSEQELGKRLIYNLDNNGYHILAPISLLDRNDPLQNEVMLNKLIAILQGMDPVGICCINVEESLYIQALATDNAPDLALFILDGHLDFLDPPLVQSVIKKINNFIVSRHKMVFAEGIHTEDNGRSKFIPDKDSDFS